MHGVAAAPIGGFTKNPGNEEGWPCGGKNPIKLWIMGDLGE